MAKQFIALSVFIWLSSPAYAGELLGQDKLCGVAKPLVDVLHAAALSLPFDIQVIDGVRTLDRQRQLVAMGVSWTMDSRHLYGLAVDVAPVIHGQLVWDWEYFPDIAKAVKDHAGTYVIEWGGDWQDTPDGPHFQLSKSDYPNEAKIHYTFNQCQKLKSPVENISK